ncbi:MAG: hypothetical protein LCH46_00075 [Proteobacteria bacterium]|nr:hypothetical protein [Pseudomonadota bacterium]
MSRHALPFLSRWPAFLAILGGLAVLSAIIWWGLVFRQVVSAGYMDLSSSFRCAGFNSTICDLAMSLCTQKHWLNITWYSPLLLWLGLAAASVGLLGGSWRHDQSVE